MTAADASLAIAAGLVFGAAVCRLTVWAHSAGEHGTALARTYLTPLADWALVAIAGHGLALILTADAAGAAWAITAVLACLALALRNPVSAAALAPAQPPSTQPERAAIAQPARSSLWARTGRESFRRPPQG